MADFKIATIFSEISENVGLLSFFDGILKVYINRSGQEHRNSLLSQENKYIHDALTCYRKYYLVACMLYPYERYGAFTVDRRGTHALSLRYIRIMIHMKWRGNNQMKILICIVSLGILM